MVFDEIIFLLILGGTIVGGFLLLVFCAMHVQARKLRIQQAVSESARKSISNSPSADQPIEVS